MHGASTSPRSCPTEIGIQILLAHRLPLAATPAPASASTAPSATSTTASSTATVPPPAPRAAISTRRLVHAGVATTTALERHEAVCRAHREDGRAVVVTTVLLPTASTTTAPTPTTPATFVKAHADLLTVFDLRATACVRTGQTAAIKEGRGWRMAQNPSGKSMKPIPMPVRFVQNHCRTGFPCYKMNNCKANIGPCKTI